MPEPGPAFYLGAEDDEDELHIRLAAIAKHYGVTFKELIDGGLHVLPLLGKDATLCAVNQERQDRDDRPLSPALRGGRRSQAEEHQSIDTLSRAFAGNEIDRVQVYAFAMHMQALAMVAGGSVTILSHPSLAGMASGSGISGSTAWHGAFRFRQYLKGVKDDRTASSPTNDLRELEFKKNQYGPRGRDHRAALQHGLFLPEAGVSNLERLAREAKAEQVFMDLLRRFAGQGQNVSHSKNSGLTRPRCLLMSRKPKSTPSGKATSWRPCGDCSRPTRSTPRPTASRPGHRHGSRRSPPSQSRRRNEQACGLRAGGVRVGGGWGVGVGPLPIP